MLSFGTQLEPNESFLSFCETFYGGHRFLKKMPFLVGFIFFAPQTIILSQRMVGSDPPPPFANREFHIFRVLVKGPSVGI